MRQRVFRHITETLIVTIEIWYVPGPEISVGRVWSMAEDWVY
jgi:hypothetical protein